MENLNFKTRVRNRTLLAVGILCVVGLITGIIEFFLGAPVEDFFVRIAGNDMHSAIRDLYIAQVSITFIVTSLVSFMSSTSKKVYWVDIITYKLVEPRFTSFIDMVVYLIVDLALSTVFLVLSISYIYLTFIISVILLAVLSIKMIGAYFGEKYVASELRRKYLSYKRDIFSQLMKEEKGVDSVRDKIDISDYSFYSKLDDYMFYNPNHKYYSTRDSLHAATLQAIEEKDIQSVKQDLKLLFEAYEYDEVKDLICLIVEYFDGTIITQILKDNMYWLMEKRFYDALCDAYLILIKNEKTSNGKCNKILEILVDIWCMTTEIKIYSVLSDIEVLEGQIKEFDERGLYIGEDFCTLDHVIDDLLREERYDVIREGKSILEKANPLFIFGIKHVRERLKVRGTSDRLEYFDLLLGLCIDIKKVVDWVTAEEPIQFGKGWDNYLTEEVLNMKVDRTDAISFIVCIMLQLNSGFAFNNMTASSCDDQINEVFDEYFEEEKNSNGDVERRKRSDEISAYVAIRDIAAPDIYMQRFIQPSTFEIE